VNGGCCLVAWEKVTRPFDLGGLGIHNLEVMCWALQMRWLWIERTKHLHQWKFESSGIFPSSSAYRAVFVGALQFEPWKRLWKAWAPNKCKTFVWLAIRNRCWTADRLQKRGVPHPDHCPLCDQEDETAQHLLTSCVFAQQLWFHILQPLNLTSSVPSRQTLSFADWWRKSARRVQKQHRKGFNSLVILGAWILWKHKNACVFDGFAPSIPTALQALQKRISFEDYRGT